MDIRHLHDWDVTPQEAIAIQQQLAGQVIHDQALTVEAISTVAGVDVSVKQNISRAAVVVLRYPDLSVLETVTARMLTPFPYIPGLLSFREGPVLEDAFCKLQHEPDVLIFDGMGRIHPRKLGIAAHMGLWLDRLTIGCGKNHLVGHHETPASEKGAISPLTYKGEQLGVVLRTRTNVKPVYISPGHRLDIPSAVEITLSVTPKYRLPEPIRAAHNAAGDF